MARGEAGDSVSDGTIVAGDDDRFAPVGEDVAPGILRFVNGTEETFEFFQLRLETPEAGLIHADDTPGCFDVRVRVQALVHKTRSDFEK